MLGRKISLTRILVLLAISPVLEKLTLALVQELVKHLLDILPIKKEGAVTKSSLISWFFEELLLRTQYGINQLLFSIPTKGHQIGDDFRVNVVNVGDAGQLQRRRQIIVQILASCIKSEVNSLLPARGRPQEARLCCS